MKRACIYARVSTEEQGTEGTSLDSQARAMLNWAAKNDYEVPDEYILREEWSGAVLERPLLETAKQLARDRKIDVLLVYEWDRLSRDTDHQIVLRWMFAECWGVQIVSISEPQLEGFRLKLQRGMEGIFAEWEREKIRERTTRGRRERARQGKLIGGYFLYGTTYNIETGTREKDPETFPVLFLIFRMTAGGNSLGSVARHLNTLAISAPAGGQTWHISTVSRIIRNRAYIGETHAFMYRRLESPTHRKPLSELRYRKGRKEPRKREDWIAMPNATPILIPLDLFEAAQQQLSIRSTTYGVRSHRYLLGGRAKCVCGAPMHGTAAGGYRYYRCSAKKRGLCKARLVRADRLEQIIWKEVKKVLLNPEMIMAQVEVRAQKGDDQEATAIRQRLARLDMQERRFYRLYAAGDYDRKILDDELDRLTTEREGLQERLREIESAAQLHEEILERKAEIEEYCRRARENIESFDFEEKKLALNALNVNVLVEGKEISLRGMIPTQFDLPIASRGWRWGL